MHGTRRPLGAVAFNSRPYIMSADMQSTELRRDQPHLVVTPDQDLRSDPRWLLVERILHSAPFQKSPNLHALLSYLAEYSILGKVEALTERQIGEAVFGKPAGYSPAEAETLATSQIPLPQVAQLKELNQDIVDLAKSYRQAGDSAFAQSLLQTDLQLGQRYSEGPAEFLINTLVGIAIQRNALSAMDPGSPSGAAGQTVADQLNQLAQQKDNIKTLVQQTQEILPTMPDEDWINYQNRRMMFGEQDAFRWVLNKYGTK